MSLPRGVHATVLLQCVGRLCANVFEQASRPTFTVDRIHTRSDQKWPPQAIWPWFRYMVSDGLGFRFRLFNRENFPRSLVNWYRKKDI